MQTTEGIITVVQESRFQMMDDDGVGHHFLLAHGAAIEPADLAPLQARATRVRIIFGTAPNMIAYVAHEIELLDRQSEGASRR